MFVEITETQVQQIKDVYYEKKMSVGAGLYSTMSKIFRSGKGKVQLKTLHKLSKFIDITQEQKNYLKVYDLVK